MRTVVLLESSYIAVMIECGVNKKRFECEQSHHLQKLKKSNSGT